MVFFEAGAKDALKMSLTVENRDVLNQATIPDFQIILKSNQNTQSLRTLTAEHANTLIKVPGIIITSSKTRPRATLVCARCTKCQCVVVSAFIVNELSHCIFRLTLIFSRAKCSACRVKMSSAA